MFAHYTFCVAFVFEVTNVNAYLCAHSLECFSELVFLFFAYIYLLEGEGYSGPIKKTKNQEKGNWKNSEMVQGDHDLVNRLLICEYILYIFYK